VLELHTADEPGDLVERAERGRPVGDGESGIVAGDQCSGDDEEKRPAGENDREAVQLAIIRSGDGFQSRAPWRKIAEAGASSLDVIEQAA